jgi:two-component system chemotaxis response regulator CheB
MKRIRILVVEDSLTVRRYLVDVLSGDSTIDVVGEAVDGREATVMCQALRPDVITLDLALPVMDGLEVTEHIMALCPTPILIISSSENRGEMIRTYDALAAGAVEVLEKPRGDAHDGGWERSLLANVKLVSRIKVITHMRGRLASRRVHVDPAARVSVAAADSSRRVVALGASTGGPASLASVLGALQPSFPWPILVVIHIGKPFAVAFAQWLGQQTALRVALAQDGQPLTTLAGHVLLAPPDQHLVVRGHHLRLNEDPPQNSCRPSVDALFASLATEVGAGAIAGLLTGMGRDGADGLLAIRKAGGRTIAQDEATSVIFGMPREAILCGAAEYILPLHDIGPHIARLAAMERKT